MTTLVRMAGVSKTYSGVRAVDDVSLDVATGERLAVIGPNGAGKSTLFGMMAGEHRPTSGTVSFQGRDVTAWSPSKRARAGISRTFQVARLLGSSTVRENVFLACYAGKGNRLRCWDRASGQTASWAAADELLSRTSLASSADRPAGTLAQGARKTLEMVMAVAQEPALLLLDEPTAGMSFEDAAAAVDTLRLLLVERPDMTMVLTAHDMEVIFALADRVVLMARGRVLVEGTPAEVAAAPQTREIYLGTAEPADLAVTDFPGPFEQETSR